MTSVEHDSRLARAGTLYCCLRGATSDGHEFAPAAVAGGATALLVDHALGTADGRPPCPRCSSLDTRPAMGQLAAAFHGHPSRALTMVGITGTNGKTTTTEPDRCGARARRARRRATIGTLTGAHTTPESPELQARLAGVRRRPATPRW